MSERDELKLQFCAAAKPASQPRQERRNQCEHAGDITECRPKSPAFSLFSEFSAGTRLNRGEIAALAGVAPFNCDSGTLHGQRKIQGGRKRLRRVLYSATVASVRCNPALRPFYQRLRATGKPAKVALVAAMRRLLLILNAMLKTKTPWRSPCLAA